MQDGSVTMAHQVAEGAMSVHLNDRQVVYHNLLEFNDDYIHMGAGEEAEDSQHSQTAEAGPRP